MTLRGLKSNLMKILSWNYQGLAKPKAIRSLRLVLSESKPDIAFLCEVKTHSSSLISKALSSHSLSNIAIMPPAGYAGGLIVAWKDTINCTVISLNTSSFIHTSIFHDPNVSKWLCTFVYTPCNPLLKASFWNSISELNVSSHYPWLLIGDFNAITSQLEKKGGLLFASSSSNSFTYELNNLGLIDLGFNGYPYT